MYPVIITLFLLTKGFQLESNYLYYIQTLIKYYKYYKYNLLYLLYLPIFIFVLYSSILYIYFIFY